MDTKLRGRVLSAAGFGGQHDVVLLLKYRRDPLTQQGMVVYGENFYLVDHGTIPRARPAHASFFARQSTPHSEDKRLWRESSDRPPYPGRHGSKYSSGHLFLERVHAFQTSPNARRGLYSESPVRSPSRRPVCAETGW